MNAQLQESTAVAVIPPKPPTVIERALAVFSSVPDEEALRELAKKSVTITEITNEAGKDQCHASRMVLKNTRLEIKRTGEEGRDDAVKTSKAIIARQNTLIAIIQDEEDRLAALQKVWDDRIAAEKEAKIQAEIARVAEIQRRIDGIRNWPVNAANQPSMLVGQMLAQAQAYRIEPDVFQEHAEAATAVLAASTAALSGLLAERKAFEAAQLQAEEDRKELARLKADELERQRIAREAQAKADADAKAERDRQEAAAKAERDAEAARQAEANRIERERISKEEADAKANREADAKRVAGIRERIDELRGNQMLTATSGSKLIGQHILDLENIEVDDSFQEFEQQASGVKLAALHRLLALHEAALTHETEQRRLADERTENERKAAERQAELDAQAEAQRQANAAEAQRLADQQAEIDRQQKALRKAQEPTEVTVEAVDEPPVQTPPVDRNSLLERLLAEARFYVLDFAPVWDDEEQSRDELLMAIDAALPPRTAGLAVYCDVDDCCLAIGHDGPHDNLPF